VHDGDGTGPKFFDYTAGAEAGSLSVAVTASTVRAPAPAEGRQRPRARGLPPAAATATRPYRAFVARVGRRGQPGQPQEANAQALRGLRRRPRQSVAGVSLDEEMTGLIRFQRAYQASSRAMSTMDEMLDVLINRTGGGALSMRSHRHDQRSTLADLNRINERVTKAQQQGELHRQISRPSDDPYDAARALQCASRSPASSSTSATSRDGQGWQETREEAMSSITDSAQRARGAARPGHLRHDGPGSRESIAKELDQ
jgi:hypothetical protein